jgi:hypothetical protein
VVWWVEAGSLRLSANSLFKTRSQAGYPLESSLELPLFSVLCVDSEQVL